LAAALTLRNTSDRPLHVRSGDAPAECATRWLTFVVFDDAGAGRGLRDDRKDGGHQPTVLLQLGEATTYPVDLGRFNEPGYEPRRPFRPARGRIRLHVSVLGGYYSADAGRPGLWKGRALSNKVSIIVR
jgi:hypothetical protein